MALRRIGCLVAVCTAFVALGGPVPPHADEARGASASASSVVPLAQIDIRGLFGDENEPDENEGGRQTHTSSGTSLPVVLLLVVIAALAGAYAAIRVRRLWLRLREWGSDMRARL
jgi:hypothetical protein